MRWDGHSLHHDNVSSPHRVIAQISATAPTSSRRIPNQDVQCATMSVTANAQVWAACTCVLYGKMLLTTTIQGGKTFRAGGRPPEDSKLSIAKNFKGVKQNYGLVPADAKDVKLLQAKETEHRWRRIVANDIETIPIALLVFAAGVLTNANETVHLGAMVAFTAIRCWHTYAYAHSLQPQRAIAWSLGHLAALVGVGNVVLSLLLA